MGRFDHAPDLTHTKWKRPEKVNSLRRTGETAFYWENFPVLIEYQP
jgi:hypothetical protein